MIRLSDKLYVRLFPPQFGAYMLPSSRAKNFVVELPEATAGVIKESADIIELHDKSVEYIDDRTKGRTFPYIVSLNGEFYNLFTEDRHATFPAARWAGWYWRGRSVLFFEDESDAIQARLLSLSE